MNQPSLRNLGAAVGRNHFTGVPVEFIIPPGTDFVFVGDMFYADYQGGAEATTEAILTKCPKRTFKVHSTSLTAEMLEKYKDLYWIITNFTQVDVNALNYLATSGIKYSVIEYDYKYCVFRSEVLHQKQTNQPCDCALRPHGMLVEKLYTNAQFVFWMSEKQKDHFLSRLPSLIFGDPNKHVVLSSVFTDEALDSLLGEFTQAHKTLSGKLPVKIWGVQGSDNWIKGTQEAIQYCTENKMPVKVLGKMGYREFLGELAKCDGFVFRPLDFDTCPRVVIEAKMMGLNLVLNDNVQHKDEAWFQGTPEEIATYLRGRAAFFWDTLLGTVK